MIERESDSAEPSQPHNTILSSLLFSKHGGGDELERGG